MKPSDKMLSLLVVFLLGTITVLLYSFRTNAPHSEGKPAQNILKDQEEITQQLIRLTKLQEQYLHKTQKMEQRINQLETILLTKDSGKSHPVEQISPEGDLVNNTTETGHYRNELDDYFWNEARESQWSGQAEDLILSKLHEYPFLNNTNYEVNCKSSLCRLETNVSLETGETMPQLLEMLAGLGWQTKIHFEQIQRENGETGTVVYISREGHSLPEFM